MRAWRFLALALILIAMAPSQPRAADAKPPTGQDLAEAAGASLIGKYAPPVSLTTIDGTRIDLGKLYGKKPVYLKFWATWCVPCRLQMPHFENAERTLGRDIQVVAVNADFNETKDAVRAYRQAMGLTMPIVIDDGRLADALHLRVAPQHVVIGRDGRILYVGHLADARVDKALAQAIAEPPAAHLDARADTGTRRSPTPVLRTLAGQALALGDGARPTVIFFFSPWCESYFKTSRPEMSEACLKAREGASRLAKAPGVRWLGAAAGLWATGQDLAAYQQKTPMPMPVALDETGGFFRRFRIAEVPSFVVLDRRGHEVARTPSAGQAARIAARLAASSPA